MIKSHHKRIAIVGCGGSGKTTLAFKLQEKLNLPLYHLDHYYWLPNWQRADYAEFVEKHDELCAKETWIIEGSYVRLFFRRAIHADVIIYLDFPRYKCLWFVIKRCFMNLGREVPGSPEKCKQRFFSIEFFGFLKWIWNFNRKYRYMITDTIDFFSNPTVADIYKNDKQIYILKSGKEVEDFLKQINS